MLRVAAMRNHSVFALLALVAAVIPVLLLVGSGLVFGSVHVVTRTVRRFHKSWARRH